MNEFTKGLVKGFIISGIVTGVVAFGSAIWHALNDPLSEEQEQELKDFVARALAEENEKHLKDLDKTLSDVLNEEGES